MSDYDDSHREALQNVAAHVLSALCRDLDHVAAILEDANLSDTGALDALNTLTEAAAQAHALNHRLDDAMLAWIQERHVAAVLVEG